MQILSQDTWTSPLGIPCSAPPWATLVAVDLASGEKVWEVPFGTTRGYAPWPFWLELGLPGMGGPIVTAGGLVFIGAAMDGYFRAYDIETGDELWRHRLPAGGQAVAGANIVAPLETLLTEQLTIAVDGANARRYPFTFCNSAGCVARVGFTAGEVDQFRRGNVATVRLVPAADPASEVVLRMSLSGFTAGFEASTPLPN